MTPTAPARTAQQRQGGQRQDAAWQEGARRRATLTDGRRRADVVVVGAGQAGLSAAYHLRRLGLVPATDPTGPAATAPAVTGTAADRPAAAGFAVGGGALGWPPGGAGTYVVLDAEAGPGGAWRHRWRSLRMATVNGIHDLPGAPQPTVDPAEPSAEALPRYFADYESAFELPVLRPVSVRSVHRAGADLLLDTDAGTWLAGAVVNATGTWTRPFWPRYPGQESFAGRQLHVADYVSAEELAGKHVVVVGGGISAVQLLEEISRVTTTSWFTRREPLWRDEEFDADAGRRAVALVEERVRQGLPPASVVSVTGLIWRRELRAAATRGVLDRRPMFTRIEPRGVRAADGTFQPADVIVWATGFRAALDHLAPLGLRSPGGGIVMAGTQVASEPRIHLVGYGPSSSTVGANRAGRDAARALVGRLAGRRRAVVGG
ncbi:NAD(P)-binding domain-containing protein [Georgenia muralis]|uniref:Cation diffusion facilitator CzcD-associated flavoprotein CzcO n=1 Tax=Georgenia muralis TaxID=154117 RepID=A0A3N5A0F9_9MICO|nr:NAD(P)-binding domain-containing protein [Georgenia muralis]RPF26835.1 cation diffusion facilitator CzcD-associated flavoprotein CzcO [Georgenia muralis]